MITVNLGQLINSGNVQDKNGNQVAGALARFSSSELRISAAFRARGIIEQVSRNLVFFEESRLELFKKHGNFYEETGEYKLETDEQKTAYNADYLALIATEITIIGDTYKESDFNENARLRPDDLIVLKWLIPEVETHEPIEKASDSDLAN